MKLRGDKKRKYLTSETISLKDKISFILNIINLVLIGLNVYMVIQTAEIQRANMDFQKNLLEIQRMMTNYSSIIIAEADFADLSSSSYSYSRSNNETTLFQTTCYGHLKVDLRVITPHYGKITIRVKGFSVGDSEYMNQEMGNQTEVSYSDEDEPYEEVVVSGLNRLTADLFLRAEVYPDTEALTNTTSIRFPLGYLRLEAELYDLQTNVIMTKEFEAMVVVTIKKLK